MKGNYVRKQKHSDNQVSDPRHTKHQVIRHSKNANSGKNYQNVPASIFMWTFCQVQMVLVGDKSKTLGTEISEIKGLLRLYRCQPDKRLNPGIGSSTSTATKPISRSSLPVRLKKQGTFIRGLKGRKLFKFTLATHQEGGVTRSRENLEICGQSIEKAHGLVVDNGLTLVTCKGIAVVSRDLPGHC